MPTYVAVGDSFTEGLRDHTRDDGRHVGWADRVAAGLHADDPSWRYANLAVHGRLLGEVVRDQFPRALDLAPDLVTFHAGANDVFRTPRLDVDALCDEFARAVAVLSGSGARLVLFTLPLRGRPDHRPIRWLHRRADTFNAATREVAARHGALLVDAAAHDVMRDPRVWAGDRIHLSPTGHRRIAAAVLDVLGVDATEDLGPGWWWEALPPAPAAPVGQRARNGVRFYRRHLVPWLVAGARGVVIGAGVAPKAPEPVEPLPLPVDGPTS